MNINLRFFVLLGIIVMAGILFFNGKSTIKQSFESEMARAQQPTPQPADSGEILAIDREQEIEQTLAQMSLNEKIGSLLILGFDSPVVDSHIETLISRYHISGVNILGRNVKSAEQFKKLSADLQKIQAKSSKFPFIIATDQEGGPITRFRFLKELTRQSEITTPEDAERIAVRRGRELRSLGVNMNFAPVLDRVVEPKSYLYQRTFATTSLKAVEMLGKATLVGYEKAGIMPVLKHFPGYGSVTRNPHTKAVTRKSNWKTMMAEARPFYQATSTFQYPVMTAHIVISGIDTKPATLSYKILTEGLRKGMSFDGVIITDDMEMVAAGFSVTEGSLRALEAGSDMIISTYTSKYHTAIFNALKKAVKTGRISEDRLDQSVRRILRMKYHLVDIQTKNP